LTDNLHVYDLGHDIHLIDLLDMGERARTGCYVIRGAKTALVDVGASPSQPQILAGLAKLGIAPEKIDYVILTHIHLDHAGGMGFLLPLLPNATVVCHPRAARHVIDPSRLIAGAQAVYGDQLQRLFGQILPVPEERVLIREDGETLDLGEGHFLTFYDTPGHARHHFSIHDRGAEGIFTGDTVGLRHVPELTGWDFTVILPSTSPSEFDCKAVLDSIAKLEPLGAKRIYHAHFGMTEPASEAFERVKRIVVDYDRIARESFTPGMSSDVIAGKLGEYVRADLAALGHIVHDLSGLQFDLQINAQGLLYNLEREHKKKQA